MVYVRDTNMYFIEYVVIIKKISTILIPRLALKIPTWHLLYWKFILLLSQMSQNMGKCHPVSKQAHTRYTISHLPFVHACICLTQFINEWKSCTLWYCYSFISIPQTCPPHKKQNRQILCSLLYSGKFLCNKFHLCLETSSDTFTTNNADL